MRTIRKVLTHGFALIGIVATTNGGASAQTPNYAVLYSFKGGTDGSHPNGVTLSKSGVIYGTTYVGGRNTCYSNLCGTVFELVPSTGGTWTKTVLHSFSGPDGAFPAIPYDLAWAPGAGLASGKNGTLYGATSTGGSYNPTGHGYGGTIFEMTPPTTSGENWTFTVLYSFQDNVHAARSPNGGLILDAHGNIYGTTFSSAFFLGSPLGGITFELSPPTVAGGSWTENTLINFYPLTSLGYEPSAGLAYTNGSFYGTNYFLTNNYPSCGTVYQLSPSSNDSGWIATPGSGLTAGPGGVLFGTTLNGGTGGTGAAFQLMPPSVPGGSWTETTIYNFTGVGGDGGLPASPLVIGENGVLYGTTVFGGSTTSSSPCGLEGIYGCGTIFQLSPPTTPGGTWTETILHTFTGQNGDGSYPGPLTLAPNGVLFGSTAGGGTTGNGTIFALRP